MLPVASLAVWLHDWHPACADALREVAVFCLTLLHLLPVAQGIVSLINNLHNRGVAVYLVTGGFR